MGLSKVWVIQMTIIEQTRSPTLGECASLDYQKQNLAMQQTNHPNLKIGASEY
jgi:hypothetical protein